MNFLFDVSHPAHVHLFRHAIDELRERGHRVRVTSREKDVTTDLLDAFGIEHTPISTQHHRTIALAGEWLVREFRMFQIGRRFDPDVVVSRLNPPAAHVAKLLGCPSVVFDDSERARMASYMTHPFADVICTPARYDGDHGPKQFTYDGFHELAYLHPDRFTPDPDLLTDNGVDPDAPYYVLRFVSWRAHHDVGQAGIPMETKRELVSALERRGDVYITSEAPLPAEFEQYRLPIPPHAVHDLLWFADGYVGDSQTMATEAAVLGTPAIRSNSFVGDEDMGNFVELEREYDLLRSVRPDEDLVAVATDLFDSPTVADDWRRRRDRLLEDKIDVTSFIVSVVLAVGERQERPRQLGTTVDGTV